MSRRISSPWVVLLVLTSGVGVASEPTGDSGGSRPSDRIFAAAYVWTTADRYDTRIVAIDPRTGEWETIDEDFGPFAVSPDGRRMAVDRGEEGLWLVNVAGGPGRRIAERSGFPVFAPDGRSLLFTRSDVELEVRLGKIEERWTSRVERFTFEGRLLETLGRFDDHSIVDWSVGDRLIVSNLNDDSIFTVGVDGSERRAVSIVPGHSPRFSPDGRRMAYIIADPGRVDVADADGRNARPVYDTQSREFAMLACWSPDGRTIAVVFVDRDVDEPAPLGDPRESNPHLVLIDVATGKFRPLTARERDGQRMQPAGYGLDWR